MKAKYSPWTLRLQKGEFVSCAYAMKGIFPAFVLAGLFCIANAGQVLQSNDLLTHAEALESLKNVDITISSSGNCSDQNNPKCTSLEQIRRSTILGLMLFKQRSGCPINVTGGTEVGHTSGVFSHATGWKIDISINSCVDEFITSTFARIVDRTDGSPQYQNIQDIYAKEAKPPHWDILYK
jgi:hypothetical protein